MAYNSLIRYIWLLNTLIDATCTKSRQLPLATINNLWQESPLNDGEKYSRSTYYDDRKKIEEIFGLRFDKTSSNKHYVSNPELLRQTGPVQWLYNTLSVRNMILCGQNMSDKILWESEPKGEEYLRIVIDAIQQTKVILFHYARFNRSTNSYLVKPLALKMFNHRWYILGLNESNEFRVYSFDRIDGRSGVEITTESFEYPQGFHPADFFKDVVGVFVDGKAPLQKVRIRVYGLDVDYIRSLPLHSSQKEDNFVPGEFEYRIRINHEFKSKLFAMGSQVEVLEPAELREEFRQKLRDAFARYENP